MTFLSYWLPANRVHNAVFIPKYYDPALRDEIDRLAATHDLVTVGDLVRDGVLELNTGHEIGSDAYGTGNIPFVRTSDISNWEIKTAPKQGVADAVYDAWAAKQDVRENDILFVRDGTYLIGTTCFVTSLDTKILYQSHILKIRVRKPDRIKPQLLFLALNSDLVQRQIRARQFTADIIDTLGGRFNELVLPIPRDEHFRNLAATKLDAQLAVRVRGKCFIKQAPLLLEQAMRDGSAEALERFLAADLATIAPTLAQDAVSLEFGGFEATWLAPTDVRSGIYLPKYYDPEIDEELRTLAVECDIKSVAQLRDEGLISLGTGDEPGKMAYGSGDVPFLRTSDFANWEIKHDAKQGLSEEIFEVFRESQDVAANDIFLVRDGTYLVGTTTIVAPEDVRLVYCGGLYKIRACQPEVLDPYLLLAILNSYIVKRQIRARQFTRDVIDTLGRRLEEVHLPIPRSAALRRRIAGIVAEVVRARLAARNEIKALARSLLRASM